MNLKACKDCKWCKWNDRMGIHWADCLHANCRVETEDYVNGVVLVYNSDCTEARKSTCGRDAIYFEPK